MRRWAIVVTRIAVVGVVGSLIAFVLTHPDVTAKILAHLRIPTEPIAAAPARAPPPTFTSYDGHVIADDGSTPWSARTPRCVHVMSRRSPCFPIDRPATESRIERLIL